MWNLKYLEALIIPLFKERNMINISYAFQNVIGRYYFIFYDRKQWNINFRDH